jgi:hypothetical protein
MTTKLKPEIIKRFKRRSYVCLGAMAAIGILWMFWNIHVLFNSPEFAANEEIDFTIVQSILGGGPLFFLAATMVASFYLRLRFIKLSLDPENLEIS